MDTLIVDHNWTFGAHGERICASARRYCAVTDEMRGLATEPDLKILREVDWPEVRSRYTCEHRGGSLSDFLDHLERSGEKYAHNWAEVLISREEALGVRLPPHDHRPSPKLEVGLLVCCAAEIFTEPVLGNETAECLDRIRSHRNRDFSRTLIFLEFCDDSLRHLDGLHRLLAYAIYGLTQEIPAFVCGLPARPASGRLPE